MAAREVSACVADRLALVDTKVTEIDLKLQAVLQKLEMFIPVMPFMVNAPASMPVYNNSAPLERVMQADMQAATAEPRAGRWRGAARGRDVADSGDGLSSLSATVGLPDGSEVLLADAGRGAGTRSPRHFDPDNATVNPSFEELSSACAVERPHLVTSAMANEPPNRDKPFKPSEAARSSSSVQSLLGLWESRTSCGDPSHSSRSAFESATVSTTLTSLSDSEDPRPSLLSQSIDKANLAIAAAAHDFPQLRESADALQKTLLQAKHASTTSTSNTGMDDVEGEQEELEELDDAIKRADPLIHCQISKVYNGTRFHGTVEDILKGKVSTMLLYQIRYLDGDLEHMTASEVRKLSLHQRGQT